MLPQNGARRAWPTVTPRRRVKCAIIRSGTHESTEVMHDSPVDQPRHESPPSTPARPRMKLIGYHRSSAAYRVRIALHLKGIAFDQSFIHLRRQEQSAAAFRRLNPFGLVPVLEHDGRSITQSLAIIDYLEEVAPLPPLLPPSPGDRAFVRSIALGIACDIHPLNNLRVLNYLKDEFALDAARREAWYAHWIAAGFAALESVLAGDPRVGTYCCGETPGLAEICLVPQMYNAERMHCDLAPYPILRRIAAAARALPAFAAAAPDRQPDAE